MIPEAVGDRQISKESINYDAIYKTIIPDSFEFPEPHERYVDCLLKKNTFFLFIYL